MLESRIVIIGAGVIGLAIAEKITSGGCSDVIIIERHDSFGRETSSRNSEVIHAGLYYRKETLKTQLSVRGNRLLYELCSNATIPFNKIGKLVIATNPVEESALEKLFVQATINGVPELRMLSQREINQMEPAITAKAAFFSGTTGIIDTHALMKYFERKSESNGAVIAYSSTVKHIHHANDKYVLHVEDANGETDEISCSILINCAGLSADNIAASAGIDIDANKYRIHFCKGEYFKVSNRHMHKLHHLIYPVPTPISLGIHTVVDLQGHLKLGPNAFYTENSDCSVDESHIDEFVESATTYLPFIAPGDLSPDMAGIRPKTQGPNDPGRDFIIHEESDRRLPSLINLIGIESPGLTSCIAIAEYVHNILVMNSGIGKI